MSFTCAAGHSTKPGEHMHKVVIQKRERTYPTKHGFAVGWEVVKEVPLCAKHAKELAVRLEKGDS